MQVGKEQPFWTTRKEFKNTAIGSGWILTDRSKEKRILVKAMPKDTPESKLTDVLRRIEKLKCEEIAKFIRYERNSQEYEGILLYFEHSGTNLKTLQSAGHFKQNTPELIKLFRSLARMCRQLELNNEYHPALSSQNVYRSPSAAYFILHPLLYDSHVHRRDVSSDCRSISDVRYRLMANMRQIADIVVDAVGCRDRCHDIDRSIKVTHR